MKRIIAGFNDIAARAVALGFLAGVPLALLYFSAAFVQGDFDPTRWHEVTRFFVALPALVWLILVFIAALEVLSHNRKGRAP